MYQPTFDSPNRFYTIFYDESNNHRKFYINPEQNSYNIDNDPNRKQAAATNFMLAGLAHRGDACTANASELVASLRLQKSAKELKFDQIAHGNFDAVLKSAQLNQILKWILEGDLYVHYFNLNMEYWAFIDIIDDCVGYCVERGRLDFSGFLHYRKYLDFHKDVLYRLIKVGKEKFLETLKSFDYPAIEGREQEFLIALHGLVSEHANKLITGTQMELVKEEVTSLQSLAELLALCGDIEEMTLTHNPEKGLLVDGLAIFYQHRGTMFKNSIHVFDDEFSVEDEIVMLNKVNADSVFQYKFVNSVSSPMTQISDVVAGLFAKYFDFIERNSLEVLLDIKSHFSPYQLDTLRLMKALIDKSDNECPQLLHYVMTASAHHNHDMFMYPNEYQH